MEKFQTSAATMPSSSVLEKIHTQVKTDRTLTYVHHVLAEWFLSQPEYLGDRHWPASMEFGMSAVGVPETQFLNEVRIKYPSLTIVTILCSGRPLYMNEEMNLSDAFIAAWLPGTQGGGVADVLFGKNDFVGKLSFQWPLDPCLTTQYNGTHGDDPPFSNLMLPIGYGLAYDDESPISTLKVDHLRTCTNHVRTKTKI